MAPNSHVRNAASNLLGISLLVVVGIDLTDFAGKSLADEIALVAALFLALSCILSHLSIRQGEKGARLETVADQVFVSGLLALVLAVAVLAITAGLTFS